MTTDARIGMYNAWIADYVQEHKGHVRGYCKDATQKMAEAFPELTVVPGWCETWSHGKAEHVWCETPGGTIVDPTASQFQAIIEYIKFEPGDEIRMGKCMNCGTEIYGAVQSLEDKSPVYMHGATSSCTCSKACELALDGEYNHPR